MNPLLMILTHDRLDCLSICLEMLDKANAFASFGKVVFLLNGVSARHRAYVDAFVRAHPAVSWDAIDGPGTRPEGISWMENECVKRYPGGVYVKVDEDVFVPSGWAERMLRAHERYRAHDRLALITPLIPNNAYGLHFLLTQLYPDLLPEHRRLFGCDPSPEPHGLTWQSATVGEWASRKFLDIEAANERHRRMLEQRGLGPYHEFCAYFSVGCICYDYRHWQRMGGIPKTDEPGWCNWITENRQLNVLDMTQIVLHYSFFVQQEWLDRSSLIEDVRRVNLPDTMPQRTWGAYYAPRLGRITRQIPGILRRRLGRLAESMRKQP